MTYYCPVTKTRSQKPCKCTISQRVRAIANRSTIFGAKVAESQSHQVLQFKHQARR